MTARTKLESILFFVATYLLTAIAWGTLILLKQSPNSSAAAFSLYLLGGLSPTIIALLLPLRAAKGERKVYYKRYFNFKIPFIWYVLPITVVLFIKLLAFGVLVLFFKEAAQAVAIQPWYMIFPLFMQMIIGGGLEELGWRGVLVHNYQNRNRTLVALVIGVIWACWHIPLFFIQGVSQYQMAFLPFFVQVIGLSFVTLVLYIRSQSVIPCIIFHALINALSGMGFVYSSHPTANLVADIIQFAVMAVFFLVFGAKAVKRDPLSQKTEH